MWTRVNNSRQDSDSSFFMELMYLGEMLTKTVVAGMTAAVDDDSHRHRYRILHRLVRASGLGEWQDCLTEILTGPTLQHVLADALDAQKDLTQRSGAGHWQSSAVELLHSCLEQLELGTDELPAKVDLRRWFSDFVQLRNKTRGHGAPSAATCSLIVQPLEKSLQLLSDHLLVLRRPWAYLHRNLSGKYRVIGLSEPASEFETLKSDRKASFADGVYVYFGQPRRVDLANSDPDALDFFFVNGGLQGRRFEFLSYITGSTEPGDGTPYLAPASAVPLSATHGIKKLEVQGKCFTNLPQPPSDYIRRPDLERELYQTLTNERHPVVTLVGRGGIGKTSLALTVLHRLAQEEKFIGIVWFSARDIDLLPEGPKVVRPDVLTTADIAKDLVLLFQPREMNERGFKPIDFLAETLTESAVGPLLFVFDNFETVQNPVELYTWIDTFVRLPNKVLITTRHREFKGDYSVEVGGMTESQCDELADATAAALGICSLITQDYKRELYRESDGHPYVVKILVGESAKEGRLVKVERIVAGNDEMLDALFERTYAHLTPAARRVFLTLSSWRSVVPLLAIEATLLRPGNERMDVVQAIEELHRCSFIDFLYSPDKQMFISTPLVASLFGRRKLITSSARTHIDSDTGFLHLFGAIQPSDVRHGVGPRVVRFVKSLAEAISRGKVTLDENVAVLEFVAGKYPEAWLSLADLYQEAGGDNALERADGAIGRFLENTPNDAKQLAAWERKAVLQRRIGDLRSSVYCLLQACELPRVGLRAISDAANTLNSIFPDLQLEWHERNTVVNRVIVAMTGYAGELDATDCSRFAWLYLRIGDHESARRLTQQGLDLDPNNEYCLRLTRRFF